jgi:hypothetical protein
MVAISAKKSQPSRKGTKAWRKNIDITDVEEHLEQLRHEERTMYALYHVNYDVINYTLMSLKINDVINYLLMLKLNDVIHYF